MRKLLLLLLFINLLVANNLADGPLLRPPSLMPDAMLAFPPHNLYMSPTETDVPQAWLDFCPPLLFTGLAPPEPWDVFAPLVFDEPQAPQLLVELEPEPGPEAGPESFGFAPQSFSLWESEEQSPPPSLVGAVAVAEPSNWILLAAGFAVLMAYAMPRRFLRFGR